MMLHVEDRPDLVSGRSAGAGRLAGRQSQDWRGIRSKQRQQQASKQANTGIYIIYGPSQDKERKPARRSIFLKAKKKCGMMRREVYPSI